MIQLTEREVYDAMYAAFLESNDGKLPHERTYEELDEADKKDCGLLAKHFNKVLEEKQCTNSPS